MIRAKQCSVQCPQYEQARGPLINWMESGGDGAHPSHHPGQASQPALLTARYIYTYLYYTYLYLSAKQTWKS